MRAGPPGFPTSEGRTGKARQPDLHADAIICGVLAFDLAAWNAESWGAAAAWLTVCVYVVLALYAIKQVGEARRLREDQARPIVVVDFVPGFIFEIAIENVGRSVATDVSLSFDPPLVSTHARPWAWEESTLLTHGIPTLAPGRPLRFWFDSYGDRIQSDLPKIHEVFVSYRDLNDKRKDPYKNHYRLDLRFYEGMEGPSDGLPQLVSEVKKLREEVHKWTDGIGGLKVNSSDRDKETLYRERPWAIKAAATIRDEAGWFAAGRHLFERALRRRGWTR